MSAIHSDCQKRNSGQGCLVTYVPILQNGQMSAAKSLDVKGLKLPSALRRYSNLSRGK